MSANLLLTLLSILNFGPAPLTGTAPPDAVILEQRLTFCVKSDGSLVRREYRRVRINDRRAISAFADPRIAYREGLDELTVITARTHLCDGTILPVPAYSLNTATPRDIAGWPRYANWRERIISFSGIEPGVVLELEFEVRESATGAAPLSRDLRLTANYPISHLEVVVQLPCGQQLHHRADNIPGDGLPPIRSTNLEVQERRWSYRGLPATPTETGSITWQEASPRLRFSTHRDADSARGYLDLVRNSSEPDAAIEKFARTAAGKKKPLIEQCRALSSALAKMFHLVASAKAMTPPHCRPAAEVLHSNYGNRLEAAALLSACLSALGHEVRPVLAVDDRDWADEVPLDSGLLGIYVRVAGAGQTVLIDPLRGPITSPRESRTLIYEDSPGGKLKRHHLSVRGQTHSSWLKVSGDLSLGRDGLLKGELTCRFSQAWFDPSKHNDAASQTKLVNDVLGQIVPGLAANSIDVQQLSADLFTVRVKAFTEKALPLKSGLLLLRLGCEPIFPEGFRLPLDTSQRTTTVAVHNGGVSQEFHIELHLPEGLRLLSAPSDLLVPSGGSSLVRQTVGRKKGRVLIERKIAVGGWTISPEDFEPFRAAVNTFRAPGGHTFIFGER